MAKLFPDLKLFFFLIFLCLVIFILENYHLLSPVKVIAYSVTNPISFSIYKLSNNLEKQFFFIYNLRQAAQENRALRQQMAKVLSENAALKRQFFEASAMLSQKEHLDPRVYDLIPVRPIGIDRYLRLDKGFSSGIKVGQAVVYNDNYVGKITSVSEKNANVLLLTDPDSKVAVFSQGLEGKAKGVLSGQFGVDLLMDKILHEEKIVKDDLVYSEGTEGYLPRGLILGRVSEVLEKKNELFKQAKVKQTFDLRDLDLVFVIKE